MFSSISELAVRCFLRSRSAYYSLIAPQLRPPRQVPDALLDEFTMGGQIPVLNHYYNDTKSKPLKWTTSSPWWDFDRVAKKGQSYYKQTDSFLYSALEQYDIRDKEVVIIGSEMPWYECVFSYYGGKVTTIEYRDVDCQIPGLTVMTPDEFNANPKKFDVAVSISSIEHDGLGRYGDPIDPNGDLKAMEKIKELLKPEGLLFFSVPVGSDALVWNVHRIYGRTRFPLLTKGWEILGKYGFGDDLFDANLGKWDPQPVIVLRPN